MTSVVSLNAVTVSVVTTEPPVGDASAAFKDRRPSTAPLVGGLVGSTIADMMVNQQEEVDDEGECAGGRLHFGLSVG